MILIIVEALVSSLTKHVCNSYLTEQEKIDIDGAPYWYMKQLDNEMCTFAHKTGGLDSIEIAKKNSKLKLIKKINGTIDSVIYSNLSNIKNKKEKEVIERFRKDDNLKYFINKNIKYSKIIFAEEIDTTFTRSCIPNDAIINYQTNRLQKIKQEVLKVKVNSAFDELNGDLTSQKSSLDKDDPFSELPGFE